MQRMRGFSNLSREQCNLTVNWRLVERFGVEADFVRAFFNGEKEIFIAEARARTEALNLDIYKARQPFCQQSS
jgi:hypothetical protein